MMLKLKLLELLVKLFIFGDHGAHIFPETTDLVLKLAFLLVERDVVLSHLRVV